MSLRDISSVLHHHIFYCDQTVIFKTALSSICVADESYIQRFFRIKTVDSYAILKMSVKIELSLHVKLNLSPPIRLMAGVFNNNKSIGPGTAIKETDNS